MSEAAELEAGPRWPVKAVVILTLVMLFVAGVATVEAWPFTGWRLYSNTKGPTAGSYFAYRVSPDGTEHKIDYEELPYAYRRAPYILNKFPSSDDPTREAVCEALAHGEREAGRSVAEIHVYWELRRVVPVDGERHTKLLERELRYSCAQNQR
ncbi:MAG: hypothetical protein WD598_17550 [Acidimicrobiia bacterium]